jgi:hypothetical protein
VSGNAATWYKFHNPATVTPFSLKEYPLRELRELGELGELGRLGRLGSKKEKL